MSLKNFNYIDYSIKLIEKKRRSLYSQKNKNILLKVMGKYCLRAGKELVNSNNPDISLQQAELLITKMAQNIIDKALKDDFSNISSEELLKTIDCLAHDIFINFKHIISEDFNGEEFENNIFKENNQQYDLVFFDYKKFSITLKKEAEAKMPPDINEQHSQKLLEIIVDFSNRAGESLIGEEYYAILNEKYSFLTTKKIQSIIRYVAECTFQKGIHLIHSDIKPEYWQRILEAIAGGVFKEIKITCVLPSMSKTIEEKLPEIVEKEYCQIIDLIKSEHQKKNMMSELVQYEKEEIVISNKPLNVVENEKSDNVIPGVDLFKIFVDINLLDMIDPERGGDFITTELSLWRDKLFNEYGFRLPNIRIVDNSGLKSYEYQILIREICVGSGFVYPGHSLVPVEEYDEYKHPIETIISGVHPVNGNNVYWFKPKFKHKFKPKKELDKDYLTPSNVITDHLTAIVFKYVESLLTLDDVLNKYIKQVKSIRHNVLEEIEKNNISNSEITVILGKLLREKVSIKDILDIFEKIALFSKETNNPEEIVEKIRKSLKLQISMQHADKNRVLEVIEVAKDFENTFATLNTDYINIDTSLNPKINKLQEILKLVRSEIKKIYGNNAKEIIFLCPPEIRRPFYNFVAGNLPQVTVLSYDEIATEVTVKQAGIITLEKMSKD